MKELQNLAKNIALLSSAIATLAFVVSCNSPNSFRQDVGTIFGTEYHITYNYNRQLKTEIEQILLEIDNNLSAFNPKSYLSKINRNEDNYLPPMAEKVLLLSQSISQHTNGAFDVTVAPLVNAWGFGFKNFDRITSSTIDSIMPSVGFKNISIKKGNLCKSNSATMIDLGGIAKGFACDKIADLFDSLLIEDYLIEIGGEIRVKGNNYQGKVWRIGIANPKEDSLHGMSKEHISSLQITNIGMATSGNYRNFYYRDGKKFAHTIDPRTGYPVEHNLLSATVIAPTCAEADAYATSFMVLGVEETKKILAKTSYLKAYLIYQDTNGDYAIWKSPELEK